MLQAIPRPGFPRERPRQARAATLYRRAVLVAAEHCAADPREVLSARRRKGAVAEARALAAYLSVMCFSLSRRQVARLTGRNIMVISRFCAEIELRRDDRKADQAIAVLEARLGIVLPAVPTPAPARPQTPAGADESGDASRGKLDRDRHDALKLLWARGSTIDEMAIRAGRSRQAIDKYTSKYRDDFPFRRGPR